MLATAVAITALLAPKTELAALKSRLDTICARFGGRMGYSLKLMDTGEQIGYRADERFPTASTIKTALALEAVWQVEDGLLKWTDKYPVPPMSGRQASMWSYHFKDGLKVDLDGWVNLMLTYSDNTATMVLRDWMTMERTNARLAKIGCPNTKVLGTFPVDQVQNNRLRRMFGLGMTTPAEMVRLWELIYRRKVATPAACDKLLRILGRQYWDDVIRGSAPPEVHVCNKTGAINRSRSDTGIVFGDRVYVLAVFTDNQKDQRWVAENEGDVTLSRFASLIWNTLHPKRPYAFPKGYDKFWPTGGGVEDS